MRQRPFSSKAWRFRCRPRPADAVTHARALLRDKRTVGDAFGLGLGLDLLAAALAALQRASESAVAYGAGQAFWDMVGHPQRGTPELGPLREGSERAARRQLGSDAYGTAYTWPHSRTAS